MQIIFWMPAIFTILLVTVLWHVYRENREYLRRNMETHQELQSVEYRFDQINADQQNEATKREETEEKERR